MFAIRCGAPPPYLRSITEADGPGQINRAERRARRFASHEQAARYFNVSVRSITNWHGQGYIVGYQTQDGQMLFDLDEIEAAFEVQGRAKMRDGRIRGKRGVVRPIVLATGAEQ